jgi:hypothetical protein
MYDIFDVVILLWNVTEQYGNPKAYMFYFYLSAVTKQPSERVVIVFVVAAFV